MADRVILVDGSALFYRAFFAIPGSFATSSGRPTNATYGFALMFKKLLSGRAPAFGAVVFDAPGPTFREARFPEYKAQRPPIPRELAAQRDDVERLVRAHRYPVLRVAGVEADDVIGTLTRRFRARGAEVVIVSGDKDFAQLVGEGVRMLDPLRELTYDAELVKKRYGVAPERFVDFLALTGDAADNIPGVRGIGAKGAAELLARYGDLDGVLAHVDDEKGKRHTALKEHAELARLSRELARIDCAVPLDVDDEMLRLARPDDGELNALYRELEFYSLLSRDEVEASFADATTKGEVVRDRAAFARFVALAPDDEAIAVVGLHDPPSAVAARIVGFALAHGSARPIYIPIDGPEPVDEELRADVLDLLADPRRQKVVHDVKLLHNAVRRMSGQIGGVVFDTRLASYLVDPVRLMPHDLDDVVRDVLHRTLRPKKSVTGSGQRALAFSQLAPDALCAFACEAAVAVRDLHAPLAERVADARQGDVLADVEMPLSELLSRMELHGVLVDPRRLSALGAEFGQDLAALEEEIYRAAGRRFTISSTKQLASVLFDELRLPTSKKTKSGYSTDADVLERLVAHHPIAALLLEHRKLAKLIHTYTDVLTRSVLRRDGRVHTTFQQTVAATGRLITAEPDLQRTPTRSVEGKRIRAAFIAPPEHDLLVADWSQIELRLLAHLSGDAALVEAFETGVDVHRRTAAQILEKREDDVTSDERQLGKTVNFATIYGQGATALAAQLKLERRAAERLIDAYFAAYAGVRRWLDETIALARETGIVTTLLGRRRIIEELRSNLATERMAGERIAANTVVQGSAADVCKLAMLAIDREMSAEGLRSRMVLQVHDELVFEVHHDERDVLAALTKRAMEETTPLSVPLVADVGIGPTWADAKP